MTTTTREKTTMMPDPEEDAATPEAREKQDAAGTPVILADGRTWLLADGGLCNMLDGLRDEIDDQARLREAVDVGLIRNAAFLLLKANYVLTDAEAAWLVIGVEAQPLTDAVSRAFFGDPEPRRTFTGWAASSMLANGIDPASVPTHLREHVLSILVTTGRTVPASTFIESAEASVRFAAIRSRAKPAPIKVGPAEASAQHG
jgi:hypothetical protein